MDLDTDEKQRRMKIFMLKQENEKEICSIK
jgi:hypothetical protein